MSNMRYEVRLSRRAESDLRHIYRFITAHDSRPAETWFLGLRDAIFSLEVDPTAGSQVSTQPALRKLRYGNYPHIYFILYLVDDGARRINVSQIRHGARKPL